MAELHTFETLEERNDFITECYKEGVKYSYSKKNKEGVYTVVTYEED